jgi:hypothetical protein
LGLHEVGGLQNERLLENVNARGAVFSRTVGAAFPAPSSTAR